MRSPLFAILASLSVVVGCANPEDAVGFTENDPAARLRAARIAADTRDHSAVPELITMLESDDPAERLVAIRALERITGQTLEYDHAADRAQRDAAIRRWTVWYAGREEKGA